jgi:proton-coupled amino acid transporter
MTQQSHSSPKTNVMYMKAESSSDVDGKSELLESPDKSDRIAGVELTEPVTSTLELNLPDEVEDIEMIPPFYDFEKQPESSGCGDHALLTIPEKRNEWTHTALLLVADIIGSGVLSLPKAFADMGWGGGFFLLAFCAPLNIYTGLLLFRIRNILPNATTYGTVGGHLFGRWGAVLGYFVLYFYIVLILGDYMVVLSMNVQGIFYSSRLCRAVAGFVVSALLLSTNQIRTLHGVSMTAIVSNSTLIIVLGICLWLVWQDRGLESEGLQDDPVERVSVTSDIWTVFSSMSSFIFAMGGQKIYLEIMSEMRNPSDFRKSLFAAFSFMLVCYVVITVTCYWHMGAATPGYLMDVLEWDSVRVITNILMFIHIVISYTLNQQVLCRAVHLAFDPQHATALREDSSGYRQSRIQWLIISTIVMIFAFLVSNMIPFFDDLVSLIGSICSAPLIFLFPAVFYLRCEVLYGVKIGGRERLILYFILMLGAVMMVFGTISSLRKILSDMNEYGKPFDCHCKSESCTIS